MNATVDQSYKENLLQNARHQMKHSGGRCVVRGKGVDRKVSLYAKNGRSCLVWFPTEARYHNVEVDDLKDAIQEMSGAPAFSM